MAEAHNIVSPAHSSNEGQLQQRGEQPVSLDSYSKVGLVDPRPSILHYRDPPSHERTPPDHSFHYSSLDDVQSRPDQLQQCGKNPPLSKNPYPLGDPSILNIEKATVPTLSESLQLQVIKK